VGEAMPITYQLDRQNRLMVTRMSGRIEREEAFAYLDAILADPGNESCDELIVLEEVDLDAIGADDIRALARHASAGSRDEIFRVAVVAPRDADFGIWRMFQSLRDLGDHRMAVFRSLEEARVWLGAERS